MCEDKCNIRRFSPFFPKLKKKKKNCFQRSAISDEMEILLNDVERANQVDPRQFNNLFSGVY